MLKKWHPMRCYFLLDHDYFKSIYNKYKNIKMDYINTKKFLKC